MSDLDGYCFIQIDRKLVPADIHAEEFLAEIGHKKEVIVSIRKARNPRHHRLFFALLKKFLDNTEGWNDVEEVLDAVKFSTGHVRRVMRLDRRTGEESYHIVPKSINFASMDQLKFRAFFERAAEWLAAYLGVSAAEFIGEVEDEQKSAR